MFKLVKVDKRGTDEKPGLCVGIDLQIGGRAIACPVSGTCYDERSFEGEVKALQDALITLLQQGKAFYAGIEKGAAAGLNPDDPPERIWEGLSKIAEEENFVLAFNGLEEEKRRESAEYILAHCNMFSGKGLVFSERFNQETALLE